MPTLDMLLIGKDGAAPLSKAIIDSPWPSLALIERNAGAEKTLGIAVGDRAESDHIKAAAVKP